MLRCGQVKVRIRSARGSYIKTIMARLLVKIKIEKVRCMKHRTQYLLFHIKKL